MRQFLTYYTNCLYHPFCGSNLCFAYYCALFMSKKFRAKHFSFVIILRTHQNIYNEVDAKEGTNYEIQELIAFQPNITLVNTMRFLKICIKRVLLKISRKMLNLGEYPIDVFFLLLKTFCKNCCDNMNTDIQNLYRESYLKQYLLSNCFTNKKVTMRFIFSVQLISHRLFNIFICKNIKNIRQNLLEINRNVPTSFYDIQETQCKPYHSTNLLKVFLGYNLNKIYKIVRLAVQIQINI